MWRLLSKLSLIKTFAIPVVTIALVGGLGFTHYWTYSKGKTAERTVQELRMAQSLRRAAEQAQKIRDEDINVLMGAKERETRIVERIRTIQIEVPTPDCSDLGPEWLREFNRAIAIANSTDIP